MLTRIWRIHFIQSLNLFETVKRLERDLCLIVVQLCFKTYSAHVHNHMKSFTCSHVQKTHHFPQTVHCCSSSFQPLSETLSFSSCLFKARPPNTSQSALIGQLAHSVVIGQPYPAYVRKAWFYQVVHYSNMGHVSLTVFSLYLPNINPRIKQKWTAAQTQTSVRAWLLGSQHVNIQ